MTDEALDQLIADVNEQLDTLGVLAKRIRETRSHGYNREHRALGERLDVYMDALLEDLAAGLRRLITTCQ